MDNSKGVPGAQIRKARALEKLLVSLEHHRRDWRTSKHARQAIREVSALFEPEIELYLGVETAAGWLGHLIRAFALDENASDGQRQLVINAVQGLVTNAMFAWAAEHTLGGKAIQKLTQDQDALLFARKEEQEALLQAKKTQTKAATDKRLETSAPMDQIICRYALEHQKKHPHHTPERVARAISDSVNRELLALGKSSLQVGSIAKRIRRKKPAIRTTVGRSPV
jgi:hypothetical protein